MKRDHHLDRIRQRRHGPVRPGTKPVSRAIDRGGDAEAEEGFFSSAADCIQGDVRRQASKRHRGRRIYWELPDRLNQPSSAFKAAGSRPLLVFAVQLRFEGFGLTSAAPAKSGWPHENQGLYGV